MLNTFAAIIDQAARVMVGFIVTPLLVRFLGVADFGVWQVMRGMDVQLSAFDGRAAETLKWMVANDQSESDGEKKRRMVGAAVLVSLGFLPLLLLASSVWLWIAPEYIGVAENQSSVVRWCGLLLALGLVLTTSFSILESILRGVNKGYKRIGVLAFLIIFGGVLNVLAAYLGFGIIGLAAAQVLVCLLTLTTYYYVVQRHVDWAGLAKPTSEDVLGMLAKTKWFTAWTFINTGIYAGDVILLGYFESSELVSKYVLTFYAANLVTVSILTAVSSILPGLGMLIGAGEYQRAANLRRESLLISWIVSVVVCAELFALNKSFIGLWVGSDAYIGDVANALIIIAAFQLVFIRHDAFMLNMMLDIRLKSIYGAVSLMATLLLSFLLVPRYGVVGLLCSLLVSRTLLSLSYPSLIRRFLADKSSRDFDARKLLVTVFIFTLCGYVGVRIDIDGWLELLALAVIIGLISLALLIIVGADKRDKDRMVHRLSMIRLSISGK
jgi:O-antigen/teichoic acid export membrane protein